MGKQAYLFYISITELLVWFGIFGWDATPLMNISILTVVVIPLIIAFLFMKE
ncbi:MULTISPECIES: hypothetical protein [Pantoea]|uniref:hypothetical protein n=1 Tax=Pantoea TaxID=53335 RepID=UPI00164EC81F|nr:MULTISPECIES: hypothetical protein [Pantoea]